MATDKIPVTFDFFKKYTYYEEWTEFILRRTANGNQQMYKALASREDTKELALRKYYEAFYLNPKIRDKYHIRIKSVPKRIKDKLLTIPALDTSMVNKAVPGFEKKDINKSHARNALSGFDNSGKNDPALRNTDAKRKLLKTPKLSANDVCEEDHFVKDDDEPSNSDTETNYKNTNEQLKSSTEKQLNEEPVPSSFKASNNTEIQNNSVMENKKDEHPKSSNNVQQKNGANSSASRSISIHKTSSLNYKDLKQYMHCCPLTLDDFRKYSNINELIEILSAQQKSDAVQRHIILERFYVLFYLVPEHRKIVPFSKIRLLDNCPPHIKEKFFSIPTRLYLKEQQITNPPIDIKQTTSSAANPHQKEAVFAVDQQVNNKSNEKLNNSKQPASKPSDKVVLNNSRVQINNGTSQIIISPDTSNSRQEKITNCNEQKTIPSPTVPVSLDEFKKFTHFEEIVEKLFKIKAKNNEDLFLKYKSSPEAFVNTLENYYRAFYLFPAVREICPVRMKLMPNFLKNRLLKIPEGANTTSFNDFKLEQLVSPDLNAAALNEKESNVENSSAEKTIMVLTKVNDASSSAVETNFKITNEQLNPSAEKQINEEPIPPSSKVSNDIEIHNNSVKENEIDEHSKSSNNVQQKNPKNSSASPPSSTNEISNLNYKDLKQYMHCCPLTMDEFSKYSNINELIKVLSAQQKSDATQRQIILERFYVLFYLVPEHRKIVPFSKIRLLDNCPPHIKEKFFSIPTRLYLKEQHVINLPNDIKQTTSSATNPHQKEAVGAVDQHVNSNSNGILNNSKQPASKPSDKVVLNNSRVQINNGTSQIIISTGTAQTTIPSNNSQENSTNSNQQKIIPVSLDEFKKFTHFEEIVEKLFKIKAKNNEDLFIKYKSSSKAFINTLENYYRAFYLYPAIREICPIRIKPVPNSLKNHLLQIPEGVNVTSNDNFKVEQLVLPEINIAALSDKDTIVGNSPAEKSVTELTKDKDAAYKFNNCLTSLPKPIVIKKEIENDAENSNNKLNSPLDVNRKANNENESTSPLGGTKRASNESNESPSPKRQKVQQTTQENSNNTDTTKKSYKDLLPYAHCCPVSRSDFCKYTNVSELFRGFCQKRYKSVQKLPFMLKRAYILFYLAPKNRSFKPFNKLKILDECPKNLRDKIFEIPTNLYLEEENTNDLQNQETQTQKITAEQQEDMNTSGRGIREPIKILENILLQPASLPSCPAGHSNKELQCSNPTCVFHHITHIDFMEESNILSLLPEPHDITCVQKMFKEIIYKIIKQRGCDKKYSINGALLSKLLSHQEICEECENDAVSILSSGTTTAHSKSQNERVTKEANKTIIEESPVNNERTPSTTKAAVLEEKARHDTVTDKSVNARQTECSGNAKPIQQEKEKPPIDLCKYLRNDKIFSLFCQKMLEKLKKSIDETTDFASETYEIFLRCNEIPLREILNEFSNNNEEIVQRILKNSELCDVLQCYYFCRYLTNSSLALKYPLKLKQQTDVQENCEQKTKENTTNTLNKNEHATNNSLVTRETNLNTSNVERITPSQTTHTQKENSFNSALNPEKVPKKNNDLEKAKRIFFRNVEKTNTLPYLLRTTFGLKQLILRTVLTLTFKEFLENTNVYEGKELYADNHIVECMYRYVFHSPIVWPTNLYVTLEFLCKFLHEKNIRFEDYSTMLTHISPKLLHWSVLLPCTDIVDCVKNDYEKRTGKLLDTFDTKRLKEECIEYYDRCWKYEKWVSQVPLVYEEFYKDFLNDNNQGDVIMNDEPALQRVCKGKVTRLDEPDKQTVCNETAETANNIAAAYKELVSNLVSEVEVETFTDNNAERSITGFDCVLLPNTQQQMELLPAEVGVSNDPLNNSSSMCNLNVSSSSEMSCTVVGSLGKPNQAVVKPEPTEQKLLSHLLFYEDDNSDIQCTPYEDEIIDLNNTLSIQDVGENLPPSQIHFEETAVPHILSNILANSDSSNSLMSLAQHQSPGDAAFVYTQECTQQTQPAKEISTNLIQLPDVSLRSSGENEKFENVQEKLPEHNRERLFPISFEDTLALCGIFSPEQTNTLNQQEEQEFIAETVYTPLEVIDGQQERNMVTKQQPTPCVSVQPLKKCAQPSIINKASLPLRRVVTKASATNKRKKDVAKVRPLQKTDLVPQIQHNTRPLQTKPVYTAASSTDTNKLPSSSEILPSTSLKLNLTSNNTNYSSNLNEQSSKNASIKFQLSPLGTHIYISQELNKNCSVFDNTTLLRIVDHDYYHQNATNLMSSAPSQTSTEQLPGISLPIEEQQTATDEHTITQQAVQRSTRRNSLYPNDTLAICSKSPLNNANNTMPCIDHNSTTNEQPASRGTRKSHTIRPDSSTQPQTSISVTKQHVAPRIITRRSSSLNANTNNDKNLIVRKK